jgi:hypothetical protein
MKNLNILPLALFIAGCVSQKPVTVVPTDYDISDNLDLEAVASVFGESSNLEDFEQRLNNPLYKISNLDLNEDGYVDYLRVVESVERGTHIIAIQAALGNDLFQDVATIDVEKDTNDRPRVQFIGHPYFYGPSYFIDPLYYHTPVIVSSFWGPSYVIWQSPYYYGYYPSYYSYWRPFPVNQYVTHVHVYKNEKNTYKYVPERQSRTATAAIRDTRRNDYVSQKPTQTFETRTNSAANKKALEERRNSRTTPSDRNATDERSNTPRSSTTPRTGTTPKQSTTPRQSTQPREKAKPSQPRSTPTSKTTSTPRNTRPASGGSRDGKSRGSSSRN